MELSFSDVKQKVWDNRKIIIILIAIFILAFAIRGHLLRYDSLFEFDSFYHARVVQDLVTQGYVSNIDPLAYYEVAGGIGHSQVSLYHYVSAGLYDIISFGQPFNKVLLTWTIQFFPVIFGAIICLLLYFLAREVFNSRKIGVIAAFIGAVTPAFAYRTMAGAQGDNSFGFIWMILGFFFLIKSVKNDGLSKKTLINSALAGISFGLMSMSWNMYLLIPLVVIAYAIFAIVLIASSDHHHYTAKITDLKALKDNAAFAFFAKIFVAMAIFHVMSFAYGENWIQDALGYVGSAAHLSATTALGLMIVAIIVVVVLSVFYISRANKETKKVFFSLTILALYAGFFVMMYVFMTVPDLVDRTSVGSMVGEESVGKNFFGTKYNDLIVLPWLALALLPLGLFMFKKRDSHTQLLFFFWVIITLFMAWYKLKFTFVFGLAIAPAAAIIAYLLFEGLKKFNLNKGIEAKTLMIIFFFIIATGVAASAVFFPDYVPYNNENPQWVAAENWIISSTPADAKLFNWWDQGHILAYMTDRKVSTDNRNLSEFANRSMAEFVTTYDANRGYTIASKEIGADYVVLDSTMFNSAPTFEYYMAGRIDGNVNKLIQQKYGKGSTRIMNCYPADANTIYCEGNAISITQWSNLATKWKSTPDDFISGSIPVFYYRSGSQLLALSQGINNTNLAKVWLDSNETSTYYTEAYSGGGVKIVKIMK